MGHTKVDEDAKKWGWASKTCLSLSFFYAKKEEQKRSLCRAVSLEETLGRKANKQGKAFSTAKKTSHPPCSLLDLAQNPFLRFASLTSAIEFLPFLFLRGNKALPNRKLFLLLQRPFFRYRMQFY